MTAAITPMEALRRLIEVCKLIDFADCKDGAVWQALVSAQGVAEGVVRDIQPVIWIDPTKVPHEDNGVLYGTNRQILLVGSTEGPFGGYTVPLYGDCVYAAPVAAQPSKNALADEVIAALEALHVGCTEQSWIGWQNGDGEEVGTRLQAAIDAYKAIPTAAVSAAPSGEGEQVPIAWMRKWAADGEKPEKVKGRWPGKFKFMPVTESKIFPDDVPLVAAITATKE